MKDMQADWTDLAHFFRCNRPWLTSNFTDVLNSQGFAFEINTVQHYLPIRKANCVHYSLTITAVFTNGASRVQLRTNRGKMAAAATMMPNFGQKISAKSDLVPDWTSQEVSTGVSTWVCWPERTEQDLVLFLWRVFEVWTAAEWDSTSSAANDG